MEPHRNRPRHSFTLSDEAFDMLLKMAARRGLSMSSLLEMLIRREARKKQ